MTDRASDVTALDRLIAKWRETAKRWEELASACVSVEDERRFEVAAGERRKCASELEAAIVRSTV